MSKAPIVFVGLLYSFQITIVAQAITGRFHRES